jgi:hypothetical protein
MEAAGCGSRTASILEFVRAPLIVLRFYVGPPSAAIRALP